MFGKQEFLGVVIVLVFFVAVEGLRYLRDRQADPAKSRGFRSAFVGLDNRGSTSKTVALGWTLGVAFMVITVGLIAIGKSSGFLGSTLDRTSDLYLVLLGGPYAAAVIAKAAVTNQVNQGTLQKAGGNPNPLDIVSDDTGSTDIYDLQYTLFNLIALVIVLSLFLPHPDSGLPDIPNFLAILTGGSALTYTVNKATSGGNAAALQSIIPGAGRVGATIKLYGQNLAVPAIDNATLKEQTQVTVGGVEADLGDITPIEVTFKVPKSPSGPWSATAQDVQIKTNSGDAAKLSAALSILGSIPVIDDVQPNPLDPSNASVVIRGRWFLTTDPDRSVASDVPEVRFSTSTGSWAGTVTNSGLPTRDTTLSVDLPKPLLDVLSAGKTTKLNVIVIRTDNATALPYSLTIKS